MYLTKTKTKLFKGLVIVLIAGQLAFGFSFLFTPKPAKAFWGVGDISFDTIIGNIWQIVTDIGTGIAYKMALNYANKYIQKFSDKLIDKYRIKDYLNYEKVLSGYYLNQLVAKTTTDPDLLAIYGILATDVNNRFRATNTATGQSQPALAALKQKLDQYYYNTGGINSNLIYYPSAGTTDIEYFQRAQAYFSNPPDFTTNQVYGQFGQMFAESQSAAAMEEANSDGFKNGRSDTTSSTASGTVGGSSMSIASVIQNPAAFIKSFSDSSIERIFDNNFGMNSESKSAMIGQLLGDFIFNKLNLNTADNSVLDETSNPYSPNSSTVSAIIKTVDLDKDGVPDGEDTNADGIIETCYHGENAPTGQSPPDCKKSTTLTPAEAQASPYYAQICKALDNAVDGLTVWLKFQQDHIDQTDSGPEMSFITGIVSSKANFKNDADANIWGEQGSKALSIVNQLLQALKTKQAEGQNFDPSIVILNRHSVYLDKIVQSLFADDDVDLKSGPGNGDGGSFAALAARTKSTLQYIKDMRKKIGKCDKPNTAALAALTPPGEVGIPDSGGTPPDDSDKHLDQTDLVVQVKADLIAQEVDVSGSCGAFEITKRVAWALSADGAGLLSRTSGDNCNGRASDIIMYTDGYTYDILIDAGAGNVPQWFANATVDPALFVAPTDPGL